MKDSDKICGNCASYMKFHGEEWHGKCAYDDEEIEYCTKACECWEDSWE